MSTLNCQLKLDLQPRVALDCRVECASSVRFLAPDLVVYPAGRHFAVHHTGHADAAQGSQTGFLLRRLGHPHAYEEGGAAHSQNRHAESLEAAASFDAPPPLPCSHLTGAHWNTQSLVRLQAHERDFLSRSESHLLSCFAVHPSKKLIAWAEFDTELRIVTISVADVHAATEEDFSQIALRQVRTSFILVPCVQQLISDRGRREARDRRDRHSRRKQMLRRMEKLKKTKSRLEERRSVGSPEPQLAKEIESLQTQIDEAQSTVPEKHQDSDSDLEGYRSDELLSDDESEDGKTSNRSSSNSDEDNSSVPTSRQPQAAPTAEWRAPIDSAVAPAASTPHHLRATENWTLRTKDKKLAYDAAPGVKYAEDYPSADAAHGPPPPFIPDHSKEELLFSRVLALEWSRCGKYLAMVCDGPRYPLLCWEHGQKEMIGSHRWMNQPAHRIEIRPTHGSLTVVTLGPAQLRIYEIKTRDIEHQHTFVSPVTLHAKETFIDVAHLHQFLNSMLVLTSSQMHFLHHDQVVSSLPFSSAFVSVPRCLTPTDRGYAIALDGLILLYEFKSSNTLFVGETDFTDALGVDQRKRDERIDKETRERALRDANADRQLKGEDGLFQTSLFERLHTLSPTNGGGSAQDVPEKSRESFDVFLARTVPLFRPVPGHAKPAVANMPSLLASQSTPPHSGLRPRASPAPPAPVVPGAEIFRVHAMTCSPDRQSLVLSSKTREIISVLLKDVDVAHVGDESSCVSTLTSGLHHGAVNDMAACAEQPLIVSCSTTDKSVRIHNYLDRACEIIKLFEFSPLCVSFHPLGYEIAVGFHLNLLTYRVLPDELVLRGEMAIPSVSLCKYSHGGQYLAAVSGKTIVVFSVATCKTAAKFNGGQEAIMAIDWNADDTSLFSVGLGGHLYEWSLQSHSRVREFASYDSNFVDVSISPVGEVAIAGVALNVERTFCIHLHSPSAPSQFAGAHSYTYPLPPDAKSQNALGIGIGINNLQKTIGLFTQPNRSGSHQVVDPAFNAAYAYARRPAAPANAPPATDEFSTFKFRANASLPVFSSFSRALLAREQSHQQAALAVVKATHSRFKSSVHSTAADALAAVAALKVSRATNESDPLLEAYRSDSFPQALPSAFRSIRPPHPRVAWVQMGRIWFLLCGTHRGSVEIWRTPIESYPAPMFEVGLHTEPISSIQVCQKLGVIVTAAIDGSIFVSSLCMMPFTFLTPTLPEWAEKFPTYHCLLPNFFKNQPFPHLSTKDFEELYADQRNAISVEKHTLEKYRRAQEKRLFGPSRNVESEDTLLARATVMVRKQAYLETESALLASRHVKAEYQDQWVAKLLKDERRMKSVLRGAEDEYKQNLVVHQDEKKRLQVKDLDRERTKHTQLNQAEKAHAASVTMLERLYERKLALEAANSEKQRKEFQDFNARLSIELATTKTKLTAEVAQLRSLYEEEKESHVSTRASLESKLKTVEAEVLVLLEEQDDDHDQERVHDQKSISNRVSGLTASLSTARDDHSRLQAELAAQKLKNKSLGEQVSEWRARYHEEIEATKAVDAKLKDEKLTRQQLELDLSERATDAVQLESSISQLKDQRLGLRDQVAALLLQIEQNNIPRAKMELEGVIRELDGEFEEKAHQLKLLQKDLHDKNGHIVILSKENHHLTHDVTAARELLDRLREDLIRFKDINKLRTKYAEFVVNSSTEPTEMRRKIEHEFTRQRKFYADHAGALQEKLDRTRAMMNTGNARRVSENVHIMQELNDLRHRNKDFKEEALTFASELSAIRLKERLNRSQEAEQAARALRDPLHTARHHASAQSRGGLSKLIATHVDAELNQRRSGIGALEVARTIHLNEEPPIARVDRDLNREYERQLSTQRAAATEQKEQVQLLRQMKEEGERMLVNSYRRISEQEKEIGLLRDENDNLHAHRSSSSSAARAAASASSHSADYVDALLVAATRKRLDADSGSSGVASSSPRGLSRPPPSVPRPPLTSRHVSASVSAAPSPRPSPRPSTGSQTARALTNPSPAAPSTPRSGVPQVSSPKRWHLQAPSTAPPTTLRPRANAVIAEAKQRTSLVARARPANSSPEAATAQQAIPLFDFVGLFATE